MNSAFYGAQVECQTCVVFSMRTFAKYLVIIVNTDFKLLNKS